MLRSRGSRLVPVTPTYRAVSAEMAVLMRRGEGGGRSIVTSTALRPTPGAWKRHGPGRRTGEHGARAACQRTSRTGCSYGTPARLPPP